MNFDSPFSRNVIPSSPLQDIDPIVIVEGVRTPITRAKKKKNEMHLAPTVDHLLVTVLKGLIKRSGIDSSLIEDVVVGNVLQPGGGAVMARMSALEADIPISSAVSSVNRQCSSGLQAIVTIVGSILMGSYDIGIAAGAECMTHDGINMYTKPNLNWASIQKNPLTLSCTLPMGITSDNIAKQFNITREDQDKFALESHQRAKIAQSRGEYAVEIIPVTIPATGITAMIRSTSGMVIDIDDGIRYDCSMQGLKKLKPVFTPESRGGTTTAGNASQRSDGAAAVLIMKMSRAKQLGLLPKVIIRSFAIKGVSPDIMGIGPAVAIPAAVKQAGLTLDQIDYYEINEAFASQCLYCIRYLGLDPIKVNAGGGAIALGHPLGSTGTRLVVSILHRLLRTGSRYGVVSMCVGTGMGAAMVIENFKYAHDAEPLPPRSKL